MPSLKRKKSHKRLSNALVFLVAFLLFLLLFGGLCLWAVVAGGASNLFDRLAWGFVVDFIEPLFVSFAVFNVADCFIVLGVLGAALTVLLDLEGAK